MRREVLEKKRGGKTYKKVDSSMLYFIVEILEETPLVTVSNLNKELRRRYPNKPEICDETLSNAIDGLAFTLKLSRDTPAQRNSSETKVDRKQHVEWLMSAEVVNSIKIYIDEFGCNIPTKRNFGRSREGQRSFRLASTQSGNNVTVCAAISSRHGLMHYIVLPWGMKRDMFCQFLMEVSANVIAEYGSNPDVHMLFDNAPSHRNLDDSLNSHTLPMRPIPKYSPMLNPIESAFSSWKAELKKKLLSANQDILIIPDGHERGEATLSAFRFNQLKAFIDESSGAITADKSVAWENHSVTYYARCLQMETSCKLVISVDVKDLYQVLIPIVYINFICSIWISAVPFEIPLGMDFLCVQFESPIVLLECSDVLFELQKV